MMKHLKRLSALLIALAIFFTGIPASAFYEDEEDVTLTEVQETDYSSAKNDVVSFELLILPQYESGTTYSFTYDGFARNVATKVSSRTLSSYTYNAKGLPQTMTYGNGVVVSYGYDSLNRQTSFSVNNTLKYQYRYDGYSRLSELIDLSLNRKTRYEYDILGRPTSEKVIDSLTNSLLSKLNLRYDDSKNRFAGYDVMIGSTTNSTDYVYGGTGIAPDLITAVNRNGTQKISYSYDGLNRLSTRNLNNFLTEYTYLQGANTNSTTTLVSSMKNGDETLAYTYDELGNITSISKNGTVIESYTYNDLNMLRSVTRGDDVYNYVYDSSGNIKSVKKNGTATKTYTYGDSEWKDLLTAYNGQPITYDNIGNPLTYYNGSTFTWSDGRKLTGITKGTDTISYTYDSNGLRASKTVNGTTTEYYWLDGTLYAEKTGSQYIYFHYDDNGIAYGFTVKDGTTTTDYYYIHNLQGDVIGILDTNGTKVVEYTYDAWGKILATTGSLATTIGELNPFRYRGYYYDAETDFYYCRARYYDPEICRWINAEPNLFLGLFDETSGIFGYNVYSYCANNPVMYVDDSGEGILLSITIGAVVGGVISGAIKIYENRKSGRKWNEGLLSTVVAGSVGGAISCIPIPGINTYLSAAITGGLGNVATNVITSVFSGNALSFGQLKQAFMQGARNGLIGNACAKLVFAGFTKYFDSLTKANQKAFLAQIGKTTVTNRVLTEIRQQLKKGLTPSILSELYEKYGYSAIVSAVTSSAIGELGG